MSTPATRLSRAQVREIDRLSVERYHIPGIVLMENAARGATEVAVDMLPPVGGRVIVVCGGGNNGGDGLAVSRHLHNRGHDITVALTIDPAKYAGDAEVNYKIVRAMGLPVVSFTPALLRPPAGFGLLIDAIFGTGLSKPPRAPFSDIVQSINAAGIPVLSIDLPSGLECDSGEALGECVVAARTVTFVAEKLGFANPAAKRFLGKVVVSEIGCPRELIAEVSLRATV